MARSSTGSSLQNEPARQKAYRRLYLTNKHRLDNLDDTIDYLLALIEHIEERLDKLEAKNVKPEETA